MAHVTHRFVNRRTALAALFLALVLGVGALPASPAGAQNGPAVTTLTVNVLTCLEPGCTEIIEDTAPTEGVLVEVSAPEGGSLGSCTTDATGACALDIEWFPTVTLTFDEATIPDGYALTGNPVEWPMGEEPQAAVSASVLLFPVGGFPPEPEPTVAPTEVPDDPAPPATAPPVSQLPSTGSGLDGSSTAIVLTASALAMATLGLAVIGARRLLSHDEM